jgi:F0F1-type ATP synthase delta subunit
VIPSIAGELREEADRRSGIVRAHVKSATPLSDAYVAKLAAALGG